MFENQPKGLYALALANTGERFGYYTMLAIFVLFLQANFGWGEGLAGTVYSTFLMLVYFLPIAGGAVADKIGFGKCVTFGILIMFLGYFLLAIPAGSGVAAISIMVGALLMICIGTSLFKGNLQVMVGNLYDDPKYASQRDAGFSIFYMAINIGALFAPTAALKIMDWAKTSLGASEQTAYHYAFGVACISLIVSICIYYGFRWTFANVDNSAKKSDKSAEAAAKVVKEETPEEKADTKSRLVALFLVFAVVIFFWMAFHQNGLTLTYFARDFVVTSVHGAEGMLFDVTNLLAVILIIYALFALFQSKTSKGKTIAFVIIAVAGCFLGYKYNSILDVDTAISAPIFQQFNPCFVVGLTPVSMAIFGWLASRGKEPTAPRKIGYGMLVAGAGYVIMIMASVGLSYTLSDEQRVSPNWLVSTYLVLTFAELLLSPMGISFVSKVAPQKYQGLMMGCWFGATAIGNFLVQIPAYLWKNVPLTVVWGVLVALCLASFVFIFSVMKKLEKVC
ncbi:peptide MFS transporter [Prevotella sp.]|uniref:peptide MFS transporter n=1 Tax=Prevotella sp. TaxID=59823 RepID=UPI002F94867A